MTRTWLIILLAIVVGVIGAWGQEQTIYPGGSKALGAGIGEALTSGGARDV